MTQRAIKKHFFGASNQTVDQPDATYHYDGEGRRVKKIVGTEVTVFVYNAGGQLVAEYSTTVVPAEQAKVSYLTTDHLGSPRVTTDQNGVVTNRKDFSAFGEETTTPERTQALKYQPANIRQDYTGYEKDDESGLEFAQARYYNVSHGRFTSPDPLMASANVKNPQTLNRYSYVLNSPYKFVDPLGLISSSTGACGQWCQGSDGGGGGYSDNYSNNSDSEDSSGSQTWEVTRTTTLTTQMNTGNSVGMIKVTIFEKWYETTDSKGAQIDNPSGTPQASNRVGVNVTDVPGSSAFNLNDKVTIQSVTKDIMTVALEKNVSARVALALGITESYLGVGSVDKANIDKATGKPFPWKENAVNPLQLSAPCSGCKSRAKPGTMNRLFNIRGAMDEFIAQSKRSGNFLTTVKGFGGEGQAPSQVGYSAKFLRNYNGITVTRSSPSYRCYPTCSFLYGR